MLLRNLGSTNFILNFHDRQMECLDVYVVNEYVGTPIYTLLVHVERLCASYSGIIGERLLYYIFVRLFATSETIGMAVAVKDVILHMKETLSHRQHQVLPVVFPGTGYIWAAEIESGHGSRILDILDQYAEDRGIIVNKNDQQESHDSGLAHILYTKKNMLTDSMNPIRSCSKYINRMFYVPNACRDLLHSIKYNSELNSVIKNPIGCKLKLMCHPKHLEDYIGNYLTVSYENLSDTLQLTRSNETFNLLLQCVYSEHEGLFRWGLMDRHQCEVHQVLFEDILANRRSDYITAYKDLVEPVCRAYYKLFEVFNTHMPVWWNMVPVSTSLKLEFLTGTKTRFIGIDVGASPGGWTQFLAQYRYTYSGAPGSSSEVYSASAVLAIDPGDIRPEVLNLENVVHVPHTVQSLEAGAIITRTINSVNKNVDFIVVCDMNCMASDAIDLLCKHVLVHITRKDNTSIIGNSNSYGGNLFVVLTLKLMKHPKQNHINRAQQIVCDALYKYGIFEENSIGNDNMKCVHINANSLNERTIVCKIKL